MKGIQKFGTICRPIPQRPAINYNSSQLPANFLFPINPFINSELSHSKMISDTQMENENEIETVLKRINGLVISQLPKSKNIKNRKLTRRSYPPLNSEMEIERPTNPMTKEPGFGQKIRFGKRKAPELCIEECRKKYELEKYPERHDD